MSIETFQLLLIIFYALGVIPAFYVGYTENDNNIVVGVCIGLLSWLGLMLYAAEDDRPGGGY